MSVKQRKNEIIELLIKINFLSPNGSVPAWSSDLYKLASKELSK